jgi:hypothetical protein
LAPSPKHAWESPRNWIIVGAALTALAAVAGTLSYLLDPIAGAGRRAELRRRLGMQPKQLESGPIAMGASDDIIIGEASMESFAIPVEGQGTAAAEWSAPESMAEQAGQAGDPGSGAADDLGAEDRAASEAEQVAAAEAAGE